MKQSVILHNHDASLYNLSHYLFIYFYDNLHWKLQSHLFFFNMQAYLGNTFEKIYFP